MNQKDRDMLIRLDENVKTIKATLVENNKRFASKWIEWPVKGILSVIVLGVVSALVNTVVHAVGK